MTSLAFESAGRVALVAAHPGHELRLSTWVAQTRPLLFIITKGARSGGSEVRIQASRALALHLGAVPGDPFGAAFDRQIYQWILDRNIDVFSRMVDRLRDAFVEQKVGCVVMDAWQNYNPVHDLTHLLARVAAVEASKQLQRPILRLDYPVVLGPLAGAPCGPERMRMVLSEPERAVKMQLVARYPEIADDVEAMLKEAGPCVLDTETLHHLRPLADLTPTADTPPWYEQYGEARVDSGVYASVLRWSHMMPIVSALVSRLEPTDDV
jgi:hypothetical protein